MADIFVLLHKLHLPAVFIELSMLIYRNIFVMLQEALRMEYAQKMRLGYSDISGSIHALSMLAGNLFIRSWDSAERTLIAMDSRCYDGTIRVLVEDPPVSKTFLFGLVGFELVLIYLNIIIPV
jgi:cobalt/nickel transport system permease protein